MHSLPTTGVREKKKQTLWTFDAKAFFEVRRGVSDVVFREESEFDAKTGPKRLKNSELSNIQIFQFFQKSCLFYSFGTFLTSNSDSSRKTTSIAMLQASKDALATNFRRGCFFV